MNAMKHDPSTPESQPQPWSQRWQSLLSSMGYDLNRGRSFLRRGRLQEIEVRPGVISATLEDTDRGVCQVEVLLPVLRDEAWNRILDELSGQALFAAQLLAGELPESVDAHFQAADASLLPADGEDLDGICSCCADWELPCKHVTAALYALGQMLDEDPWALFRLRGRTRQQVLQALRARRSDMGDASPVVASAPEDGVASPFGNLDHSQSGPPLSSQMDEFWGKGRKLDRIHHTIAPPNIRLMILRRLGHPPFSEDSLETYDALAEIYERVSEAALNLAFAPEPEEESE